MRVVSLFSGAGGLDLGFIQAGHEVIWANDLYKDAVETYKYNIGNHILYKNIMDVDSEDIPECDVVIGGFPCQGFSVANIKRNALDERNALYKELVRVINAKKPMFFVAENVKGLMSFCKGQVFKMILNDFTGLGYRVASKLLNAADFGVPQKRERVVFVGVRNDVDFEYEFPQQTHSENGLIPNTLPWVSIGQAFRGLPDPDLPHSLYNHEYSKYKLTFNGYLGHRLIDPDKPAPTVTARGDDRGGVVVLHHPSNQRRMSCRELAIVQGFPLNYRFLGTKSSVYRQIANAVPPMLGEMVARKLYK
ncbi:DNA cytosine methyltransferase [Bilophila wadsworthia]|uniref:DNA cytosine methyltransferase n=1 Tax=Bilophila wadsworthia TaxID=35833 RepID=UPI0032C11EC3